MAEFGWAYVGGQKAMTGTMGPVGSVLLKKSDTEITGSPNLTFNTSSMELLVSGALTASTLNLYGLQTGSASTGSYLALDSNFNVVLTSSVGGGGGGGALTQGGGVIGTAEDGTYTDGLFVDFTPSTPIGTAIDRINEVLLLLAPPQAPNVQSINYEQPTGVSAKLSFDNASYTITDYSASFTDAGFDAVRRNEVYEYEVSGSNVRIGIYDSQDITGSINYDVTRRELNSNLAYTADAFSPANAGTLKLELNGTVVHSVDLASLTGSGAPEFGTEDSLTGDSGFIDVSLSASTIDGNGNAWTQYQYRTARYKVSANDQRKGWNYVRVVHTVGAIDYASDYIEWLTDPDGAAVPLSMSNPRIEDITTEGSVFLSGVEYNTQLTASYKAEIHNIYRNVFPDGYPVSFVPTRSTTPNSQSLPDLSPIEDETKVLGLTASFHIQGALNPTETIGLGVNASHPLKTDLTNQGTASATGFLIFDDTPPTTTNLVETFIDETYRITSGSYISQLEAAGATWNSEVHLTSSGTSGYDDGMVQIGTAQYSGRLYSPVASALPNNGDFASLANVALGNPDYSGETGIKTYYRKIQNTSGDTKYDMEFSTTKAGTLFDNSALGTGNAHFFIKIPGVTGWMDVSQDFSYGNVLDGDGALINGAANDTDSNNNVHHITFGTASVAPNQYVVVKMVASSSWAGYLSQIDFTLGASLEVAATPHELSDIDMNNSGINAKLSFGTSNTIPDYNNATGSSISLLDYDSNSLYTFTTSGNRKGIFSSSVTVDGELNDNRAGDGGGDFPAKVFYNAYDGELILEVNGQEVHSVDLESTLAAIDATNAAGSRITVSSVGFSTTSDNIPDYNKPYRTGTYEINPADNNIGWNYARLIHRTGGGDEVTNYIEWIVDPSGSVADTSLSTANFSDFNHSDVYYQSGIGYFASRPSASFDFVASNFYRNVYQNGTAISFPTTNNCTISNIRVVGTGVNTFDSAVSSADMPALNNTPGCETTEIEITGTVLFNDLLSINNSLGLFTSYGVSVTGRVVHPFKPSITSALHLSEVLMVYSGSNGSTNLNTDEYFNTEDYRIVSGNYANQADTTDAANAWDSTTSVNNAFGVEPEYNDGMVTVNGYAISPTKIGNSGDTRSTSDGGSLQAPSGNPNYSNLTQDVRTYYRYFRNETGLSKPTFSVKLYGDANIVAKSGAFYTGVLDANKNINVELKVPFDPSFTGLDDTSTAWGDVVKPFSAGTQPTTDGVGIYSGGGTGLDQTVDSNGTTVGIQLQEKQVRDDQYFVVKISAHKDWTGYLSRIEIIY